MPASLSESPTEEHQLPLERPHSRDWTLEFAMIAEAIRRHRVVTDHPSEPKRPADHALYRVLDELDRYI
jgi:hypothetical protein